MVVKILREYQWLVYGWVSTLAVAGALMIGREIL